MDTDTLALSKMKIHSSINCEKSVPTLSCKKKKSGCEVIDGGFKMLSVQTDITLLHCSSCKVRYALKPQQLTSELLSNQDKWLVFSASSE